MYTKLTIILVMNFAVHKIGFKSILIYFVFLFVHFYQIYTETIF